jgi:hypothetical protein
MSANLRNGKMVTHDPGERISWTNRPPLSLRMDTNLENEVVTEADPEKRRALVHDTADAKRERMKLVCSHCHTPDYINAFYTQYDEFVVLFNEKFARPGEQLMKALAEANLLTKQQFDEEIEWTWYYLWHHEGRRARHGASMMAPDYAHWHGMSEVAERFYMQLIPQARELANRAEEDGEAEKAQKVRAVIAEILARPEHEWFEKEKIEQRRIAQARAQRPSASPEARAALRAYLESLFRPETKAGQRQPRVAREAGASVSAIIPSQ